MPRAIAVNGSLPIENRLLAALSAKQREAILPHLTLATWDLKEPVYANDEPIRLVVFPNSGVFSLLSLGDDEDAMIEVATVGNEGFLGLPVFLGSSSTPGVCFAQAPCEALHLDADAFREIVARDPEFTALLNRYTLALFAQIAQSSFCNRVHTMTQRCARWMLMTEDRTGRPEFTMTHDLLSHMIGVRRATVTKAVGALQDQGLIHYSRGTMRIENRKGLEAASCECYAIVQQEHRRLLG